MQQPEQPDQQGGTDSPSGKPDNLRFLDVMREKKALEREKNPSRSEDPRPLPQADRVGTIINCQDWEIVREIMPSLKKNRKTEIELYKKRNRKILFRIETARRYLMRAVPALGLGTVVVLMPDSITDKELNQARDYVELRDDQQDVDFAENMFLQRERTEVSYKRGLKIPRQGMLNLNRSTGRTHDIFRKYPGLQTFCPRICFNIGLIERIINARKEMAERKSDLHFGRIELRIRSNDPESYLPEVENLLCYLDSIDGKSMASSFQVVGADEERDMDSKILMNEEFEGVCNRAILVQAAPRLAGDTARAIMTLRKGDAGRQILPQQQASISVPDEVELYRKMLLDVYLEENCEVKVAISGRD